MNVFYYHFVINEDKLLNGPSHLVQCMFDTEQKEGHLPTRNRCLPGREIVLENTRVERFWQLRTASALLL